MTAKNISFVNNMFSFQISYHMKTLLCVDSLRLCFAFYTEHFFSFSTQISLRYQASSYTYSSRIIMANRSNISIRRRCQV